MPAGPRGGASPPGGARSPRRAARILRLLLLTALASAPAGGVRGQRCGDELWAYFKDATGRAIPPEAFESVTVSASYGVPNLPPLVAARPQLRGLRAGPVAFALRVECGIVAAELRARRRGRSMTLRVRNVPGDAGNILVDGAPFAEGTREVDLGGRPLRNVEEARPAPGPRDAGAVPRWIVRPESLR